MSDSSSSAVLSEGTPAQPAAEQLPRTFGVKDLFTTINLLGGLFAIIFCLKGNIRYAGYAFLLGYFGDALDGLVARLTHTGNRFGQEFDLITDHLTQCIAPAVIVFASYQNLPMPPRVTQLCGPYASFALAATLASLLVIAGSVRHARHSVVPVNFPMAYMGLPRTVSAFIVVSFLNSTLFIQVPGGKWAGIPLFLALAVAHILPLPFHTHRVRAFKPYVKVLVICFFVTTIFSLLFLPRFVFDVTFAWIFAYALTSWIPMEPEERQAFFARAKTWAEEVRRAR